MEEDVLRSIAWRKRLLIAIPFINPGAHFGKGLFYKQYRLIGDEILDLAGSRIPCFQLRVESKNGDTSLWISKKDQQLLKQVRTMPNGDIVVKVRIM